MRSVLRDMLALGGLAAVVGGVWQFDRRIALIVCGTLLLAAAVAGWWFAGADATPSRTRRPRGKADDS